MTEFLCGALEGFYGRPWTDAQRHTLFSWLGEWGMNAYLYAPKDDLKHRARWRTPYTPEEEAALRGLVEACRKRRVRFIYGLAPGLDISYSSPDDEAALRAKVNQLRALGVDDFALLFDDIPSTMKPPDDAAFPSFAAAQCSVTNHLLAHVPGTLLFCPTEYCARFTNMAVTESAYLRTLGEQLAPDIGVFWTGPEVVSEEISVDSVRELRGVIRRKPVLWDNLHANDYDARVFLGPYSGRPLELRDEIAGVLSNPNCEFEANMVPLLTLARWTKAEGPYDPRGTYLEALEAWRSAFETHTDAFTVAELELLGDLCYLPFEEGARAEAMLKDARAVLESPDTQGDAQARFEAAARALHALIDKLMRLENRELLYTLYPYVQKAREEVMVLGSYLRWVRRTPQPGATFRYREHAANTYRGGFTAAIHRLLPPDANSDEAR